MLPDHSNHATSGCNLRRSIVHAGGAMMQKRISEQMFYKYVGLVIIPLQENSYIISLCNKVLLSLQLQ